MELTDVGQVSVQIAVGAAAVITAWCIIKPKLYRLYECGFARFIAHFSVKFDELASDRKKKLFESLKHQAEASTQPLYIVEVGVGSGANFQYYPAGSRVLAVDPNDKFREYLESSVAKANHLTLDKFVVAKAEDMNTLPQNSADAVVSTKVLCSVDNLDLTLSNIKNVLKPGGVFYYLEHVKEKRRNFRHYKQILLTPFFRKFSCELTRDIGAYIKSAGFSDVKQEEVYPDNMNSFMLDTVKPFLFGTATK